MKHLFVYVVGGAVAATLIALDVIDEIRGWLR